MGFLDGILGGSSDFFSGGMSSILGLGAGLLGAESTSEINKQQMDFAEKMRSTAYQTASTDMQKAGLNPAMMFSSGSAAPIPGVQFQNPVEKGVNAMQSVIASATQSKVANATIDNLVQQNANLKASAGLTAADTAVRGADLKLREKQAVTEGYRGPGELARSASAMYESDEARNRAKTAMNQLSMDPTIRRLLDIAGFVGRSLGDILSPIGSAAKMIR